MEISSLRYGSTFKLPKPPPALRAAAQPPNRCDICSTAFETGGARCACALYIGLRALGDVLAAQRALGVDIRAGNAEGAIGLPMPTVLIVDRDRTVRFVDVHPDYTSRTEVSAIVSALAELR